MTNTTQLQASLRNARATFGESSTQYRDIKLIVDEYAAKLAMEGLSISSSERQLDEGMQIDWAQACSRTKKLMLDEHGRTR